MKSIPLRRFKDALPEPDFSKNFSIRSMQHLLNGKDMVQAIHRHDYYFMLVLETSEGKHDIDFIHYEIKDYTVHLMRPGQVHQVHLKAGTTGYLVQFPIDFYYPHDHAANQLLRKASSQNFYQLDAISFQKIQTTLGNIFEEFSEKQEKYPEAIQANLSLLFIQLTRNQNLQNDKQNITQYALERLEDFLSLLEKHIADQKQVSEYADQLHLSPYQLNAITKATMGKTSSEIINDYIILEAKRNLLATSNQVNQIAYQLGYEDVSYFIRFFKKHTGFSPEAFRQNFR